MGHPAIDIESMRPEDRLELIGELRDSLRRLPGSIPVPESHIDELDARPSALPGFGHLTHPDSVICFLDAIDSGNQRFSVDDSTLNEVVILVVKNRGWNVVIADPLDPID